jgi:hypothetical protein
MMSKSHVVQPPRLAVWLLTLFALDDEAETILGDLLEEFSTLTSTLGVAFARRWYWRQTLRTVVPLAGHGFRTAPWLTTLAVVIGFLVRKYTARSIEPAIFAVLERYQVYEHHFRAYVFFASTGIDIGHFLSFLAVGFAVALVAKGRELVATITLGLFFGAMMAVAVPFIVKQSGFDVALLRSMVCFADSLAIVIAGVIVRTRRLGSGTRQAT